MGVLGIFMQQAGAAKRFGNYLCTSLREEFLSRRWKESENIRFES